MLRRPSWNLVCWTGILALMLAAPAARAEDSGMQSLLESWEAAYNAGDLTAVAGLYTEDACRMPPNAAAIRGHEAIVAANQAYRDMGAVRIDLELDASHEAGGHGSAIGTYELMDAEGNSVDQGKWMNTSVEVDGEWKITCDIWNSNLPVPEAAE